MSESLNQLMSYLLKSVLALMVVFCVPHFVYASSHSVESDALQIATLFYSETKAEAKPAETGITIQAKPKPGKLKQATIQSSRVGSKKGRSKQDSGAGKRYAKGPRWHRVEGYLNTNRYIFGEVKSNAKRQVDGFLYRRNGERVYFYGEIVSGNEIIGYDFEGNRYQLNYLNK